jgi:hypothetical protein
MLGRLRAAWVPFLMLLFFLTLAVLLLGSTWTSPTTRTLGAGVGDPGVFTWFLRWTPFAVGRQISPFFSDYLNHPHGINLMWNTWVPLPGLLLSPLTLSFGPVLTLNVLLTLGYGLSAWSAYLAIRRFVPNHGAAAAGGLVYGFSPAMIGHSHHPNLILVFLLPWLLVLVDEILVRQRRSPVWLGVVLGVLSAAQVLVGEEVFVATVLLGAVLLVVLVAMQPRAVPGRVRYALTAIVVSLLVFAPLAALPLKAQLTGPARVQADITPEVRGSSDLLAVVTPNRLSAIAPDAAIRLGDRFEGSKETYLGLPLLLVALAVVVVRRGSAVVRAGFVMLVACLVLSLGARLRVGGHLTGVRLPWRVMEALPLLQNMVPARLALFTALFAGLLLAAALDGLWRGGRGSGGLEQPQAVAPRWDRGSGGLEQPQAVAPRWDRGSGGLEQPQAVAPRWDRGSGGLEQPQAVAPRAIRWGRRVLAVAVAVVALAAMAPPGPLRARPVVATPPFFATAAVRALPRDGVALVVPFPKRGRTNVAMVWQAEAGMWFKMPGGYFVGPDRDGGTRHDAPPTTTSVTLSRIERGRRPPELTPGLRRQIAGDFATWRVGSVVLGPMRNRRAMAGFLTELVGRPPETVGGVQVWRDATVASATRGR